MKNLTSWMKSTRSMAVIMVIGILYIIVVASVFGSVFSQDVLSLVSTVITGVVIAYFGKRDQQPE